MKGHDTIIANANTFSFDIYYSFIMRFPMLWLYGFQCFEYVVSNALNM
jgi:hypothetical protein